jgi:hypothetical protein
MSILNFKVGKPMSAFQVDTQNTEEVEVTFTGDNLDMAKRFADKMAEINPRAERFAGMELKLVYVTPEKEPV